MVKVTPGAIVLAVTCGFAAVSAMAEQSKVFGWLEMATLQPWGVAVKTKLDSGALTSSMHAENIEKFDKEGEEWVRFTVDVEDQYRDKNIAKTVEAPVKRNLKILGAGGVDHRPVVLMKICIGNTVYEEQFSLRNREEMNYPVLLGRRTIQSLGLLDVRETFLHKPRCDNDSEVMEYASKEYDEDIGI